MNNNQDNMNINPQLNNLNNNNSEPNMISNNQNEFTPNQTEPLNVIPQNIIQNQNNTFFNNNINPNINNNNSINVLPINSQISGNNENRENFDDDQIKIINQNRFINNSSQNNTMLTDLNVDGEYNGMPKVDYSKDPKVIKNLEEPKEKNTITITGEAKVFLIIIAVLLIFTFVMPTIFDLIRNAKY